MARGDARRRGEPRPNGRGAVEAGAVIYAELERAQRNADPLRYYRASGRPAEWIFSKFSYCEPYNHAANKGGKTKAAAGLAASFARGRASIAAFDGSPIALPTPDR